MKTMPPAPSPDSRVLPPRLAFEDRHLAAIIQDVEHRCRIMCRIMQVFREEGTDSRDMERDWEDRGDALTVFYEYIDHQMNTLSALREELDTGHFTINRLKGKADG